MILRHPIAFKAIQGQLRFSTCPRTGLLQPSFALALAQVNPREARHRIFYATRRAFTAHAVRSDASTTSNPPDPQKERVLEKYDPRINPPESTLPAPLELPTREPHQSYFKWLLYCGRRYYEFYKTGIKNIRANRKKVKALSEEWGTKQPTIQYRLKSWSKPLPGGKATPLYDIHWGETRAERHLLTRERAATRRLPIVFVLLLIFGEWLPLLVIYMTPVIPLPCRIPSQVQRRRKAIEARRSKSFRGEFGRVPSPELLQGVTSKIVSEKAPDGGRMAVVTSSQVRRDVFNHIARSCNLYPRLLDPILNTLDATEKCWMYLEYLHDDDVQLLDAGYSPMVTPLKLRDEEVRLAAIDRGIDVLGRSVEDVRKDLGMWLALTVKASNEQETRGILTLVERMLVKPNQWEGLLRRKPVEAK